MRRPTSIKRSVTACQTSIGVAGSKRREVGSHSSQRNSSGRTTSTAWVMDFWGVMLGVLLDEGQQARRGLEPGAVADARDLGSGESQGQCTDGSPVAGPPAQQAHG